MAKITPQKGNVLNIWLKTVEDCPSVIHDGAHCLSRASPSLHLPLMEFSGTQTALAQRSDLYCLIPELVSGCPHPPPGDPNVVSNNKAARSERWQNCVAVSRMEKDPLQQFLGRYRDGGGNKRRALEISTALAPTSASTTANRVQI